MPRNHAHGRPAGRQPRTQRTVPPWLAERNERNAERARLKTYQASPARARVDAMLQGQSPDGYALIDREQQVISRHDCVSAAAERWVDGTYLRGIEPDGTLRLLSVREKQEAVRVLEAA